MLKHRKSKNNHAVNCNPDTCDNRIYIDEGDSICDITHEIVLDNWVPTGARCPKQKNRAANA